MLGISQLEEKIYATFLSSTGVTTDSRNAITGKMFFALKGENFDGNLFAHRAIEMGALCAVVDKDSEAARGGDLEKYIIVDDALVALQSLARLHRSQFNIPIIALTGTNGKTTTKELLSAILSAKYHITSTVGNLNNRIGVPLTLLEITPQTEVAVIEMGADSLGDIERLMQIALPTYGLVTNVGKAHLQGFGTFEGVKKAKGELYDYLQRTADIVFYNIDSSHISEMVSIRPDLKLMPYGLSYQGGEILQCDNENPFLRMNISLGAETLSVETNLIGSYNAENVVAALCIGDYFGVSKEGMIEALREYYPSNNRSQLLKAKRNTVIIDAYNANPSSMEAALENFRNLVSENKIMILGDMLELGEDSYSEHLSILKLVEEIISSAQVEKAYLIGEEFAGVNTNTAKADNIFYFDNIQQLKESLLESPLEGQTILLKGSNSINLMGLVEVL